MFDSVPAAGAAGCLFALRGETITDCSTPALIFGVTRLSVIAAGLSISKSPVAERLARETVDPSEFRFADPLPDALRRRGSGFKEWHTLADYAG